MGRGAHPADHDLFAPQWVPILRTAVAELSWLLGRGYAEPSAVALVGDRYRLRERQRMAVRRSAAGDAAVRRRADHRLELAALEGRALALDGFNCLIAVEAALSGGIVLRGRDGALRDLASVHGSYRRVEVTERALDLIVDVLGRARVGPVTWYLDRPVSNSGRLRDLVLVHAPADAGWTVELVFDPDRVLRSIDAVVATGDANVLDAVQAWFDLPAEVIAHHVPSAWVVDLGADVEP